MSAQEIITIQVGGCGNYIGSRFYDELLTDHWLQNDGQFVAKKSSAKDCEGQRLDKINVYFTEKNRKLLTSAYIRQNIEKKYKHLYIPNVIKKTCKSYVGSFNSNKYIARSIAIDSDPASLDDLKVSTTGNIFNPNNFIYGNSGFGHNWAIGHFTKGTDLMHEVMDCVRFELENCDYFQGFQLCHSIGGGTGSGLGVLILEKLKDYYPNKINCNFAVYPSPKVSDHFVEPYNAVLSIDKLLKYSNIDFVLDNAALYNTIINVFKQKEAKYSDLNWIASMGMMGITQTLRFTTHWNFNGDLRRLGINLVPFPRLSHLACSQCPRFMKGEKRGTHYRLWEIISGLWYSKRNYLVEDCVDGKHLSASFILRGDKKRGIMYYDDNVALAQQKLMDEFVNWIPNSTKRTEIKLSASSDYNSVFATLITNTTAIKSLYQRIIARFAKMYKRKAFLHWYTGEGMEEAQFLESNKNVQDLITEYQDKQDAVLDDSDDDDEEEDDDQDDDGDDIYYDGDDDF